MSNNLKKYKKIKYLGKGSYGAAILVELRSDPSQKFVVKEIVIGHLKPAEQQSAKNEADVLHQMNHSNITMYIESFVENSKLYIVMEHADGGDLSGAIQQRKSESKYWQEEEVMRIFVQICLALKHVHNANILHRDLKSQNIFLTKKGMVKLGDFGIAKVLDASDDQARTQIGTPYYLSPEICESKPYGRKSDVWSLGVVLYELLALEMPFQANSLPALVHRICTAEPNYSKVETRYSQGLVSLCKSLLMKNAEVRPSLNQVVKTDFIKGHISKLLSFTLKSGTGGVLDGNALANGVGAAGAAAAAIEDSYKDIDPDEVERNIENIRNKERQQMQQNTSKQQQQPSREQQEALAKEKQGQREEEREKLRKFRQDMIVKKRYENQSDGVANAMGQYRVMESKESESGRQRSPQPAGGRPISPKSPRNYNDPRKYNPSPSGGGASAAAPSGLQRGAPTNNNLSRQNNSNSPTSQQSRGGALRNYVNNSNSYGESPSTKSTSSHNNDVYDSVARREFFANRAAALAVKAKVEAYERSGVDFNSAAATVNQQSALVQVRGGGPSSGRRPSNGDIDNGIDVTKVVDPEARIALLKAQREKERDKEIAMKEMQIKQAIEANREERRRSIEHRSKAIAFDIDLNDNKPMVSEVSGKGKPTTNRSQPVIQEEDKQDTPPRHRGMGRMQQSSSVAAVPTVEVGSANRGGVPSSSQQSNETNIGARTKKGWGPPVDAQDILQARAANRGVNNDKSPAESKMDSNSQRSRAPSNGDFDDDGLGSPNTADDGDIKSGQEVMKRLESKRKSQIEARSHAKEVLNKLREQRIRESRVSRLSTESDNAPSDKDKNMKMRLVEVMNQVEIAKESVSKVINEKERRPSLKGEESKQAATSSKRVTPSSSTKSASVAESKRTEEIRDVQQLDGFGNHNKMEEIQEEDKDDDLEDTLAVWLLQQKRNVTVRKKPTARTRAADEDTSAQQSNISEKQKFKQNNSTDGDAVQDDANIALYRTDGPSRKQAGKMANQSEDGFDSAVEEEFTSPAYREEEDFDNRPLRGKYMMGGDDVEVVGMQCMLAEALMGGDEGDDDD